MTAGRPLAPPSLDVLARVAADLFRDPGELIQRSAPLPIAPLFEREHVLEPQQATARRLSVGKMAVIGEPFDVLDRHIQEVSRLLRRDLGVSLRHPEPMRRVPPERKLVCPGQVVGAHAVAVHSRPRLTADLDVFVAPGMANAARPRAALAEFGFGATLPDASLLATDGYRPVAPMHCAKETSL